MANRKDSNAAFDAALRRRNEAWGLRDIESEMAVFGARAGLPLVGKVWGLSNN